METSGLAGLPQYATYLVIRAQAIYGILQKHQGKEEGVNALLSKIANDCMTKALQIYYSTLGPSHIQTRATRDRLAQRIRR